MRAEFREKTYEKYFGHELARLTNVSWSPDQLEERFLGFDEAFFISGHNLQQLPLPYLRKNRRKKLLGLSLSGLDHLADRFRAHFPPFRFNLIVQYKRPEFLSNFRAKEWDSWNAPYFRYDITPHQQEALELVDRSSRGRATIVYAAAAFWSSDDLWAHVEAQQIVQNSNITLVGRLNGHGRFSYVDAGGQGKAFSDPVDIESPPIDQAISESLRQDPLPFPEHIRKAAYAIEAGLREEEPLQQLLNTARTAILSLAGYREGVVSEGSLAYSLATIEAFSDAFGISFFAMG